MATLQDGQEWIQQRRLPPANAVWPTCLIIAPASVVQNWEREFQTVCVLFLRALLLTCGPQWGYFETGLYIGPQSQREEVLTDFTMGRLDVGAWMCTPFIFCLSRR